MDPDNSTKNYISQILMSVTLLPECSSYNRGPRMSTVHVHLVPLAEKGMGSSYASRKDGYYCYIALSHYHCTLQVLEIKIQGRGECQPNAIVLMQPHKEHSKTKNNFR